MINIQLKKTIKLIYFCKLKYKILSIFYAKQSHVLYGITPLYVNTDLFDYFVLPKKVFVADIINQKLKESMVKQ